MCAKLNEAGTEEPYDIVVKWEKIRFDEITKMYSPYLGVIESYEKLVCRIVEIVGQQKPKSEQDKVVRDLLADVYDSLRESQHIIMRGKSMVAYPLARRAYESLSLMVLCSLDAEYAHKWQSGVQISNSEVRKQLAKHEFGEKEESTKKLYSFFSHAAHPNREMIPHRFLGEGNGFVLSPIAKPDLVLTTDYCMTNLQMWFWFCAILSYFYRELIDGENKTYGRDYLETADRAKQMIEALGKEYNRLLKEAQEHQKTAGNHN